VNSLIKENRIMLKLLRQAALAASICLSGVLFANTHDAKDPGAAGHRVSTMTQGEVRKVDKDARKITIKHEPLQNLDMPAMTMVFQVGEPAMLEQVKTGDKIKFQAEKIGGAFTVTRIERAN
jgi:Cu(I)/Ag(I) efflux system protein CusF